MTDPAGLIAAARATSFSLALSKKLGAKAFEAGDVVTTATVTLGQFLTGWEIVNMHLDVVAKLPKVSPARFVDATAGAKTDSLLATPLQAKMSMSVRLRRA